MEFTSPRATLEETLEFANAVRRAGGGNPLDALMPAVPHSGTQCLIAKNLNFNCVVEPNEDGVWTMRVDDLQVRDRIADELGLYRYDRGGGLGTGTIHFVVLPVQVGEVAAAFDECEDLAVRVRGYSTEEIREELTVSEEALLEELLPYVEESRREALRIGHLNEKGELVL